MSAILRTRPILCTPASLHLLGPSNAILCPLLRACLWQDGGIMTACLLGFLPWSCQELPCHLLCLQDLTGFQIFAIRGLASSPLECCQEFSIWQIASKGWITHSPTDVANALRVPSSILKRSIFSVSPLGHLICSNEKTRMMFSTPDSAIIGKTVSSALKWGENLDEKA